MSSRICFYFRESAVTPTVAHGLSFVSTAQVKSTTVVDRQDFISVKRWDYKRFINGILLPIVEAFYVFFIK